MDNEGDMQTPYMAATMQRIDADLAKMSVGHVSGTYNLTEISTVIKYNNVLMRLNYC